MMTAIAPTGARKLVGIHGLRGIAAFLIVIFHFQEIANIRLPQPFNGLIGHFYVSVLLFFVLSAFALSHAGTASPSSFSAYLARRFFRIAPLFYALLLWNVIRSGGVDPIVLFANITFTFNLIPFREDSLVWAGWSVGVEMLFYLCLPMLLWVFNGAGKALVGLVVATGLSVVIWYFFDRNTSLPTRYAYFFIGSNIGIFLAGIWAYRAYARLSSANPRFRIWLCCPAIALLLYCYLDPFRIQSTSMGIYYASWGVAFALLCLWQALAPSRILGTRPLQWLGDRSFSIYLLHPIVIVLSKPLYSTLQVDPAGGIVGGYYWLCLLVTLCILLPLAEITYRLIESPGMHLGRIASNFLARQPFAADSRIQNQAMK